jgi:hypothetical protein
MNRQIRITLEEIAREVTDNIINVAFWKREKADEVEGYDPLTPRQRINKLILSALREAQPSGQGKWTAGDETIHAHWYILNERGERVSQHQFASKGTVDEISAAHNASLPQPRLGKPSAAINATAEVEQEVLDELDKPAQQPSGQDSEVRDRATVEITFTTRDGWRITQVDAVRGRGEK